MSPEWIEKVLDALETQQRSMRELEEAIKLLMYKVDMLHRRVTTLEQRKGYETKH